MSEQEPENVRRLRPDPRLIDSPAQFARSLRVVRAQAGLSIRDVARLLDGRPDAASVSTLGGWFSGSHLPTLRLVKGFSALLAVCGVSDPAEVAEWLAALERIRNLPGRRPLASPPPFRGLATYEAEHAVYFRGRQAMINRLLELVTGEAEPARDGVVAVVGPSGSGKSSLLRAGLIPAVVDSNPPMRPVLFTPGSHPIRELALQLARTVGISTAQAIEAELLADPDACICSLLDEMRQSSPERVLFIIDQFEELFTAGGEECVRTAFLQALRSVARSVHGAQRPAVVVVGMRADFYTHAVREPLLVPVLQDAQLVVGPMTVKELRQAITEPARRAGVTVDDGLVELLLRDLAPPGSGRSDVGHDSGALPLLSHALLATWEKSHGRTLTIEHYHATGGIHQAVARTAEAAYAGLATHEEQQLARWVFTRLVHVQDEIADSRRRVAATELLDEGTGARGDGVRAVLDQFIVARLITADSDTVQITHEALLTAWPRLRAWLDADQVWLRLRRRLTHDAVLWADTGHDPDGLYRGGMLQIVRDWVEDRGRRAELTSLEADFLDASLARRADELRRDHRRGRLRTQIAVLFTVLTVVAASALVYALQTVETNARERDQALSRQVAETSDQLRGSDVSLSMQLALAAYRISPTPEALSSLLNATGMTAETRVRPSGGGESIAVSGTLIAACTGAGTVQLYEAGQRGRLVPVGRPLSGARGALAFVAFADNGHLLAAGGEDGQVHLWDLRNLAQPEALPAMAGPGVRTTVAAISLSPDGRMLAAGFSDGQVWLWNRGNALSRPGQVIGLASAARVDTLAFTPDGRILVSGSLDSTVRLWAVSDPSHPTTLSTLTMPATAGRVFSVAVSPDGRTLAAGTSEGHDVFLWDITDPTHPVSAGDPLAGPSTWVNTVAFTPDGRDLAAGSSDGSLWLFDLRTRKSFEQLPHPDPVTTVAFLPDGTPVTATVDDGMVHWWQLPGPVISGFGDGVFAAVFDGDGTRLGVSPGADDNTLTLWNVGDIHDPLPTGPAARGGSGKERFSGAGALTRDGRVFYSGVTDGAIQVWDFGAPQRPVEAGSPLQAANKLVESLALNPRGDLLAVCADDGSVHLYGLADPLHPASLVSIDTPNAAPIYEAAFDPTGRLMAAASDDHHAYLYDVNNPRRPVLLTALGGFSSSAYSVAFSPDGHTLAVGSADSSIRVWNIADPKTPRSLGQPLGGPVGYIYSLAYSPAGILAASGNESGAVWLWNMQDPAKPVHLATLAGPSTGVFSVAFTRDGRTLAAGGLNHTVQLWYTDVGTAQNFICSVIGQPLSLAEWAKYVPGRSYSPPCA